MTRCPSTLEANIASAPHRGIGRHEVSRDPEDHRWYARQNQLLAALPSADYERLRRVLEPVALPLGLALSEAGRPAEHAYFPVTGIVSLTQELASGTAAEVAIVGNDGLVGTALVLGSETAITRAWVRAEGMGYRLRADVLQREFEQCLPLRQIMLHYIQTLFSQVAQNAVCGRFHTVEQQVCRLLLATAERSDCDDLALTQELIAELVGARRESVTLAAGALQVAGIIHYHRGRITVLDRRMLAERACECHAAIQSQSLRRFAPTFAATSQRTVIVHRTPREFALAAD